MVRRSTRSNPDSQERAPDSLAGGLKASVFRDFAEEAEILLIL